MCRPTVDSSADLLPPLGAGNVAEVVAVGVFRKKQDDGGAAEAEAEARFQTEVQTVHAILRHYSRETRLTFGAPTRCPHCGDYGFVKSVNRAFGACDNTCFSCSADWVITEAALKHVHSEREDLLAHPPAAAALVPLAPLPTAAAPSTPQAPLPAVAAAPVVPPAVESWAVGFLSAPPPAAAAPPPASVPPPLAPPPAVHPAVPAAAAAPPPAVAPPAVAPPPRAVVPPAQAPHAVTPVSPEVAAMAPPPPPPAPPVRPLRVLVVDDNPFDFALLEELLEPVVPASLVLVPAPTRTEGERIAAETPVDLILLDLDLPDSAGITTLLEWQHNAPSPSPVLVLSGNSEPEVMRQARALGAVQFIQKEHLARLAENTATGAPRFLRMLRSSTQGAVAAIDPAA
jgi:CheY-like chemotaxis protein